MTRNCRPAVHSPCVQMALAGAQRLSRFFKVILATALVAGCAEQDAPLTPDETITEAEPARQELPRLGAHTWPAAKLPLAADAEIESRVAALLAQMSLEEKVGQIIQAEIRHVTPDDVRKYHLGSILNGGGSFPNGDKHATLQDWLDLADAYYDASMDSRDGGLAIPVIWGTDAVHGHGNVIGATVFPHNIGLGAMHNPDLVREIGHTTAREVLATGIDWTFAPTVAVTQDDRWGRTYESYSEDPALVRSYAHAMVLGLQGEPGTREFLGPDRVLATAKHYLADGGTLHGDDQGNAVISEEELRDIHAPGYVGAIEAGVQSVMASFSSWNGAKMHGNDYLLTDVLKNRMGLDGFVIGDWNGHGQVPGCTNASCAASFNAGLDVFMVIAEWKDLYENTLEQVRAGDITIERLDDAVSRMLRVKLRMDVFDRGRPSERAAALVDAFGSEAHRNVARQAVRESLVLLKNAGGILPLQPGLSVLVTGDGADDIGKQSGGWTISWQGTGNEKSDFPHGTSILDGLRQAIEATGGTVVHSPDGEYTERPDVVVAVFGENPYAEYQGDLPTLEFEPGSKDSLAALKAFRDDGIPVVSVFLSGRPLAVSPEINASDAFVAAWLPGSEGIGVADVLVGDAAGRPRHDFKGKLSFSWPRSPMQYRLNPHHDDYSPLFRLGYGLTYASGEQGPELIETFEVEAAEANSIALYSGRPLPPWAVFISVGDGADIMLSGSYIAHPSGAITVRAVDMSVQEDALNVAFSGAQAASLNIVGPGLDLSGYRENGVMAFRVKLDEAPAGPLQLGLGERSIDLGSEIGEDVGRGWVDVSVPIACFTDSGAALDKVLIPFSLASETAASVSFGDLRYLKAGEATINCDRGEAG